jgi:hypothetical protein
MNTRLVALCLALVSIVAAAQSNLTPIVTFPVFTLNAAPVPGASIQVSGVSGQQTYYYWAVANFQVGSVLSSLGGISNAPNTLSGSNYVVISPWIYPAQVQTVDILRTTSSLAPTRACNCAVATGLTSGSANDQSNSLSSYTVSLLAPASLNLTLTNEVTGSGASHLILRQGAIYPGTLVRDLSLSGGGTVSGSGTTGDFAGWSSSSAITNAPCAFSSTTMRCNNIVGSSGILASLGLNNTPQSGNTVGNPSFQIFDASQNSIAGIPSGSVNSGSPSGILVSLCAACEFTVGNPASGKAFQSDGNGNAFSVTYAIEAQTFSNLPSCSVTPGTMGTVTDSTTQTWGATITGGGSFKVLAFCDGANWTVFAK